QIDEQEIEYGHGDDGADVDQHRPVPVLRRDLAVTVEPSAVELHQEIGDRHADSGKGESRPPADRVGEDRTSHLPEDRAEVDAHVEDGEAGIAAAVSLVVEGADDRRDVRLEEAVAD